MMKVWRLGSVRRAVRSWTRSPGFFVAGASTLALGIACTTVLFAVADHVLLQPLGFPDEDRLVALQGGRIGEPITIGTVSYPEVRDLAERSRSFAGTAAIRAWLPAIEPGDGPPTVAPGGTVSWNYFRLLGVDPALGRLFTAADEGAGRAPVAILSHDLWIRVFGGDADVVGRTVQMSGTGYEIVGVLPERYEDPRLLTFDGDIPEIWRTSGIDVSDWPRGGRSWRGIGRLAGGVGIGVAEAEARDVMATLGEIYPEESRDQTIHVSPIREPVVGPVRSGLIVLLASVGILLAISVLNAASLVVNRTVDRANDWRVRRALGASRAQLFGELLAEGTVLAAAAGLAGIGLAVAGIEAVRQLATTSLPGIQDLTLDVQVLAFVLTVVLGVSLVLGLLPLGRITPEDGLARADLRAGAAGLSGPLRRGLLVGQIAATVVLLFGAGLTARSVTRLYDVDLGIDTEDALVLEMHGLGMFARSDDEAASVYRDVFSRLSALDGVRAAGAADIVPLTTNRSCDGVTPLDGPPRGPGEALCAEVRSATPGFLEALGVPLIHGRTLGWEDNRDAAGAMVISRSAADLFWPEGDVLGRRALVHGDTFAVVGIVEDVHARGPAVEPDPNVYLSAAQEPWNGLGRGLSIVVRGTPNARLEAAALRATVQEADPREPVRSIRPLSDYRDERVAGFRLRGALMQLFGGAALALASIGLAGAVGFSVRRRRREYGVRLALGARGPELTRHALGEALRWIGAGVAVGLAAAFVAGLAARSLLFHVQPWDPVALVLTPVLLTVVGLVSAWLPARRAAKVDPMVSLRPG